MKIEKKFSATVVLLIFANFFVKFFGLLREILIAKYYGTSIYTDAYIIAHNIPTVLFSAVATAIATTFIPMYSRICKETDERRANSFTLHLFEALALICLIFTIFGELFTEQIVWIFAPGFSDSAMELTVTFVRILFPSIYAMTLFDLFGAYMQIHEKYIPYALVPAVGNGIIIVFLFVSNYCHNILYFVWGTLIGLVSQVVFYLPWSIRLGLFQAAWGGLWKDSYLKKLLPLLFPVFIGGAVNEINSMIDKSLVSGLDTGSVASLNYSHKVISLVTSVLVAAIISFQYPKLAKLASEKKMPQFSDKGQNTINIVFVMIMPISMLVILFRTEIVRVLFQRGSFDETSVKLTASALAFYAIGISAIGVRDVLVKMFYSMQNTKIPMINGIVAALTNIALDIILIRQMRHDGAAFATSLSAILAMILLAVLLKRQKIICWKAILPQMAKTLLVTSLSGVAGGFLYQRFLHGGQISILYLAECLLVAVLVLLLYFLLLFLLMGRTEVKKMVRG